MEFSEGLKKVFSGNLVEDLKNTKQLRVVLDFSYKQLNDIKERAIKHVEDSIEKSEVQGIGNTVFLLGSQAVVDVIDARMGVLAETIAECDDVIAEIRSKINQCNIPDNGSNIQKPV